MSVTSPDRQPAADQPPRARIVLLALILGATLRFTPVERYWIWVLVGL